VTEALTEYKFRKWRHDLADAQTQFAVISDGKSSFNANHPSFWLWVFAIDNCLNDLYSMWEGIIEHLRRHLVTEGLATEADVRTWKRNEQLLDEFERRTNRADIRSRIEDLYTTGHVKLVRNKRNDIQHIAFEKTLVHLPDQQIDLLLKDEDSGDAIKFLSDTPGLCGAIKDLYDDVTRQLPL